MNGVLVCAGVSRSKNIGDYMQSLAQEQFWEKYDCFVEREKLNTFTAEEKVNCIMNAWFMQHPENFPPAECINPLFISFHITPKVADRMLTTKAVEYLKQYEPIGCRDTGTVDLLQSHGINSYFSGCLTLTLGEKYLAKSRGDKVYFVDPYYEFGSTDKKPLKILKCSIKSIWYYLKYHSEVKSFLKNFRCEYYARFSHWPMVKKIMAASFYHTYRTMFDIEVFQNATFVLHAVNRADFADENAKMAYARELLKNYAEAKLVVTSRIHCSLPCIGVETPVIFVTSDVLQGGALRSSGRFGGLIDLLHVAKWTPKGVFPESDELKVAMNQKKIGTDFKLVNKEKYTLLRDKMIETVRDWVKKVSA